MKVKHLIEFLSRLNPDAYIVIRKAEEKGAYSDWKISVSVDFFPGGKVCIMAVEPHDDTIREFTK